MTSKNELGLVPGMVYQLKVTSFTAKGKTIKKQDGHTYSIYIVNVEDRAGKTAVCEYLCREGSCSDVFPVGAIQYIRCVDVSKFDSPEIIPSEMPGVQTDGRQAPAGVVIPTDQENAYSVRLAGTSIAFAMGYAKDILCAEIAQQAYPYIATEEDIDRMFSRVERINNFMIERVKF